MATDEREAKWPIVRTVQEALGVEREAHKTPCYRSDCQICFAPDRDAKIREIAERHGIECDCGQDDPTWKAKNAGKMYNTESGHAINCTLEVFADGMREACEWQRDQDSKLAANWMGTSWALSEAIRRGRQ